MAFSRVTQKRKCDCDDKDAGCRWMLWKREECKRNFNCSYN